MQDSALPLVVQMISLVAAACSICQRMLPLVACSSPCCGQCVGKHGHAVSFVGDSGSQLLVAGQGDRGGLVGWWDSLSPSSAACVAEVRGRRAVPCTLTLLRPDAGGILVFGDEAGG